jgi:hypothetical protein
MLKILKAILVTTAAGILGTACLSEGENRFSTYHLAIIKNDVNGTYFWADNGDNYFPPGDFNSKWGKVGDRVILSGYYDPTKVTTNNITLLSVASVVPVQVEKKALEYGNDSIGDANFLLMNDNNFPSNVWAVHGYLTACYWIYFNNTQNHAVGFAEENPLFRNDTLFLNLWHTSTDTDENSQVGYSYVSLDLSNYRTLLSKSSIIAVKFKTGTNDRQYFYTQYYE